MREARAAEERPGTRDHHRRATTPGRAAAVADRRSRSARATSARRAGHPAAEGAAAGRCSHERTLAALRGPPRAGRRRRARVDPHLYRTAPALVGLPSLAADERYQNAADVILEQAIRNLPLFPAASSAYTYRWNADRRRPRAHRRHGLAPALHRARPDARRRPAQRRRHLRLLRRRLRPATPLGDDPCPGLDLLRRPRSATRRRPTSLYTRRHLQLHLRRCPTTSTSTSRSRSPRSTWTSTSRARTRRAAPCGAPRRREPRPTSPTCWCAPSTGSSTRAALAAPSARAGVRVRIPTGNPTQGLGTGYGEIGPYFALSTGLLDGLARLALGRGGRRRHRGHAAQLGALRLGARHARAARRRPGGRASRWRRRCSGGASSPACAQRRRSRART